MNKRGIKEILQTEMLDFTAPLLINNLPSIDGLLVSQRQVIWGMHKAGMSSRGSFYKMLKATGKIFDYYTLGDMPLTGVMKNMGNNYILHKYLMPKGSFGNKNSRDGDGASPRYIETKLDKYSETLLEGVNKNSVDLKWNYDATEKEPIILPSMIPNILVNLRMSISVSEANKMPSHNLNDVCDGVISYLETRDIKKTIDIIKCPDLPSYGSVIYDKQTFEDIYRTGKGSFINVGKYVYDEKKNIVKIIEIPYTTYIENIYDEIEKNFDKFENEVEDFHDGTDRNGVSLELYLKKGANINVVINKLRKYTSFESKFNCNFTILDLDGKTPKLCGLEDIISMWIKHRTTCIRRELQFDLDKIEDNLHLLKGLESIIPYLEDIIKIIRSSNNKNLAIESISSKYGLDTKQSEYIVSIRLINLTKDYIQDKLKTIDSLDTQKNDINKALSDNKNIESIIVEQLKMVKTKFGKDRLTEIIYNDEVAKIDISDDLIEDYNCRILLTQNFIKKHLKISNNHKIASDDKILCDVTSNNKDTLLLFTNLGNRYRLKCCDLKTMQPSTFGQSVKDLVVLENGEKVISIVSVPDEVGYMLFAYENGNVSKINIDKYINNYTKIKNCYSMESPLVSMKYIRKDVDILCVSSEGKALIFNTNEVNAKATKNASGSTGIKLDGATLTFCEIGIGINDIISISTEKGKEKVFMMDDIAPTGKANEERRLFEYLKGRRSNKGNRIAKDKIKGIKIKLRE